MPPFFIGAITTYLVIPKYEHKFFAFFIVILFWIVYYTITHYVEKKRLSHESRNTDSVENDTYL